MTDEIIGPTPDQLKAIRESFGVTQAAFASQMGMPFRTYQDLEAGRAQVRPTHIKAAQMASLQLAFDNDSCEGLSPKLISIIRRLKETLPESD